MALSVRPLDELLAWVALAAGSVRAGARAEVAAAGACATLLAREDAASLIQRARMIEPFLASGGAIVGAARPLTRPESRLGQRAPLVLFGRGGLSVDAPGPFVAIVGSRDMSPRGHARTKLVAQELVAAGAVIVSGAARGIDSVAHETAIAAGGRTIAVLGDPVRADGDDERPRLLRDCMARQDAWARALSLSPYGPWVPAHRRLFAARNELIAAFADAVVVIEGAVGSGTRYTVAAAHRRKVPVFALPHDVDAPQSAIPNLVLRKKGRAYLPGGIGKFDVLAALGGDQRDRGAPFLSLTPPSVRARRKKAATGPPREMPPLAALVRDRGGHLTVEEAVRTLGWTLPHVLSEATACEMDGFLVSDGARLRLRHA